MNVSDLPEDIPLDPDPRVPKVKGRTTKRISDSLKTNDVRFHLLNRGITLSVESVEFDNKRSLLTLNIPEGDVYGVIDGGHTYKALTTVQKRKRNRTALATYYFLDPAKEPVRGDLPIEKGRSIPVISSLRALLEEHDGKFRWAINPRTFFDEHGTELVKIVMDASEAKGGTHTLLEETRNFTTTCT